MSVPIDDTQWKDKSASPEVFCVQTWIITKKHLKTLLRHGLMIEPVTSSEVELARLRLALFSSSLALYALNSNFRFPLSQSISPEPSFPSPCPLPFPNIASQTFL